MMKNKELNQYLDILFDESDGVCASKTLMGTTVKTRDEIKATVEDLNFVCLNPLALNEKRKDEYVTSFKSILLESDVLPLSEQRDFFDGIGLPVSTVVFSGNKSFHYVITLAEPLTESSQYKALVSRIFSAVNEKAKVAYPELAEKNPKLIDFNNINPSRLTRIPGFCRSGTDVMQQLVYCGVRVKLNDIEDWLSNNEVNKLKPVIPQLVLSPFQSRSEGYGRLANQTLEFIRDGAPDGEWSSRLYKAAKDMQQNLYSFEEAVHRLSVIGNKYNNWTGALDDKDLKTIKSAYNTLAKYPPRLNFQCNSDGEVIHNLPANLKLLISKAMGLDIRLNELKEKPYFRQRDSNDDLIPLSDFELSVIRNRAREQGLSSSTEFVLDCINELAKEYRYHPFKQVVESKPWNGHDYIEDLFLTLQIPPSKAERLELYRKYLRKFIIGIVAKVYSPGSQNAVLVLKGPQGVGKSKWLERFNIAPEIYGEGSVDPLNKDHVLRHISFVLWHVAEFDGVTGKKEAAALKDYFYKEIISERAPYARFEKYGRSCLSFCASVNEEMFLDDPTGSRRYLVFEISGADFTHKIDMQQVFAQAFSLFKSGERQWFNAEEISEINVANSEYEKEDKLSSIVSSLESGEIEVTAREVFDVFGVSGSKAEYARFGSLAKSRGLTSRRATKGGVKQTFYLLSKRPQKLE